MSDIQLVCTLSPRAIVAETAPHTHGELNLHGHVDLDVRERMPGYDAAPVIVDGGGCGRKLVIPDERWMWDVNTELRADGEWVVERHLMVVCPACGGPADFLTETVEPYRFEHGGLSKRERALLCDPDLLEIFAALDDGKAERLRAMFLRGFATVHEGRVIPRVAGGAGVGYAHVTEGAVALTGGTAKTVIGAKAGSAAGLNWRFYNLGFDGVTASAVPVEIDIAYCTWATNAPGTNSTGTTERQEYGRVISADWTGGRNWTAEPTTITVIGEGLLSPNGGVIIYDDPMGTEPDCALSEGFVIRMNAPATVNVRGGQKVTRI